MVPPMFIDKYTPFIGGLRENLDFRHRLTGCCSKIYGQLLVNI
jgi:hypothetical protein